MDSKRPPSIITRKRSPDSEPQTEGRSPKRAKHNLDILYNEIVLPRATYEYSPLQPNEIRLLHLFPADNKTDQISSELKVARLDDPHLRYEALSYTWGDGEATRRMWIQEGGPGAHQQPSQSTEQRSAATPEEHFRAAGLHVLQERKEKYKTFYIRPNLSEALRHLRDYDDTSQPQSRRQPQTLILWVDNICINQDDPNEKSMQVRMMADIYKHAESVFIWLGTESEESNLGMDFILRIPDREHQGLLSVRGSDAHRWAAFVALMRRPWFTRRWVVQELALAKEAYLRCGDVSIHWTDFVVAVEFFIGRFDTITALYNDSALFKQNVLALGDIKASAAPKMVTVTNEYVRVSTNRKELLKSLEALVSELTMFEAGDPRDSVYAVMALAWDVEEGPNRQTKNWRPGAVSRPLFGVDYQKNILQVFADFIAFCVHGSRSLDIICRKWAPNRRVKQSRVINQTQYCRRRPPPEEIQLPSWIGLLEDSAFGLPNVGPLARVAGNSLVDSSLVRRYNASGGRDAEVLFGEMHSDTLHDDRALDLRRKDLAANPSAFKVTALETLGTGRGRASDGTLYVRGFQIDCIQQISHRLYEGFIPYEWLKLGGWRQEPHDAEEGNSIPEELWLTLMANRTLEGNRPPQTYLVALNWAIERRNSNNDINTAELIRQGQPELMVKFLKRVQEVIWNRRFFILPDGTHGIGYRFGIAPKNAKVGDILCVLLGCSVPVVLSRIDASDPNSGYELVGEAYLHGVMDGEVLGLNQQAYDRPDNIIGERSEEFCLV